VHSLQLLHHLRSASPLPRLKGDRLSHGSMLKNRLNLVRAHPLSKQPTWSPFRSSHTSTRASVRHLLHHSPRHNSNTRVDRALRYLRLAMRQCRAASLCRRSMHRPQLVTLITSLRKPLITVLVSRSQAYLKVRLQWRLYLSLFQYNLPELAEVGRMASGGGRVARARKGLDMLPCNIHRHC
jgi:hypothetical protein